MSTAFPIVSWGNGTNIYEVNIRQYTREGSFKAFMKHIPRLRDMGIDILWLMPVTPISIEKRQGTYGSYYAASSYTEIDPSYGSREDFIGLIKEAHSLGMRVIIDWVANHTGYDHQWTIRNPEWYRKDEAGKFTELYGWVDVIDLDYRIPEMRIEMIRSMKYWISEFDIDGFRCDMARTVPLDFWLEARAECDAIKDLFWLAECEIKEYHETFDLTYGWEAMRAFVKMKKGEATLENIKPILTDYACYPAGARKLLFTSNHDENTYEGTEYERFGSSALAFAIFTCTWPGIPLIYSGQELPNLKRLHFFEKDFIDWKETAELHNFYKILLALRKKNKALQENASVLLIPCNEPQALIYICRRQRDKVLVILNLSEKKAEININHPAIKGQYTDLFSGEEIQVNRKFSLLMPQGDFRVYEETVSVMAQ
ncbi:MAG: alpha-amylase family glycosyl hydrolase [Bacteroidota bacterium]